MSTPAETAETTEPKNKRRRARWWRPPLINAAMLALCLAALRQWGTDDPWARLDVFVGTYLVLNLVFRVYQVILTLRKRMDYSEDVAKEASGLTFNPRSGLIMALLITLGRPLMFLDYGHLHLLPILENPILQSIGLGMYVLAELGWIWVDGYLVREFARGIEGRGLITSGPYSRVRHPRYSFLIFGAMGVALALASVIGWIFALSWLAFLVWRMPREEMHLRQVFGEEYAAYVQRSSRLIPGLY